MSIHAEHPFLPAEGERNQLRRFRGRLSAPVTAWTTQPDAGRPVGLAVSSMVLADGEPGYVLGLLDPDSDLAEALGEGAALAVSLLTDGDVPLADALGGVGPAPGGPFRMGEWTSTDFGPVPAHTPGWLGARVDGTPAPTGWSVLVRARVESVTIGDADPVVLSLFRGRYRLVSDS